MKKGCIQALFAFQSGTSYDGEALVRLALYLVRTAKYIGCLFLTHKQNKNMDTYTKKDFSYLLGASGFSDQLLQNHFTLYEGYVTNTNKLIELLQTKEIGTPEYSELQRRFGWEWNGMRLHELYFENMQREEVSDSGPTGMLKEKMISEFGSVEEWQKKFEGIGTMRGIGWVVLFYDQANDKLLINWINEHDLGLLAGCKVILVMDVFEHAFMIDYGLKRVDYIKNFFTHIHWDVVSERFEK